MSNTFKLTPPNEVVDTDHAEDIAKEWQQWASEQNLSYAELAHYQDYFVKLARDWDLTKEFKENGII